LKLQHAETHGFDIRIVQSLHRSAPIIHAVCHTLKNATFGTGTLNVPIPASSHPAQDGFPASGPIMGGLACPNLKLMRRSGVSGRKCVNSCDFGHARTGCIFVAVKMKDHGNCFRSDGKT